MGLVFHWNLAPVHDLPNLAQWVDVENEIDSLEGDRASRLTGYRGRLWKSRKIRFDANRKFLYRFY
jgi:hypothetical protein